MQCLSSLAEYMDHMSFLDSSLHYQPLQTEGSCRPQVFGWTGAEVKSGMTDDIRLECVSRVNGVNVDEIHAALGHLSFRKCKAIVSEAWDRAQQLEEEIRREAEEELTLPVAPHKDGFSLTQTTSCDPRWECSSPSFLLLFMLHNIPRLGHAAKYYDFCIICPNFLLVSS